MVALGALATLPHVRFDFDPLALKDPASPAVQILQDLFDAGDALPYAAEVVAPDRATAAVLSGRLEALPEVASVVWLDSFVPGAVDEKLAVIEPASLFMAPVLFAVPGPPQVDPPADRAALEDLEEALDRLAASGHPAAPSAAWLGAAIGTGLERAAGDPDAMAALAKRLFGTLPPFLAQLQASLQPDADAGDPEALPQEVLARYRVADRRLRLSIVPAGDMSDPAALSRFVEAVEAVAPMVTGNPVQIVRAGEIVARAMAQAVVGEAVLIAAFLLFALRSVTRTLLVLAPVCLAGLLTVAGGVVFDMPFNFANAIVLPLLIGLGVDSGIHWIMRLGEGAAGANLARTTTPRAVLISALTTIASFGSLALSDHRCTASMGVLLTLSVCLMLVCVQIILPALLTLLRRQAEA